uniref:Ig-like domain-containing protein n=1 Tax=Myotis lucifugus TaxID=59463 RepID=G1QC15_MYOLU
MGSRLFCCVALCLLGAGIDTGAGAVTQTPKHLIKARKQQVTLKCSYISGHLYVYWYQQAQDQGPQFLTEYFNGKQTTHQSGLGELRFLPEPLDKAHLKLHINSLEPGDSAVYLCASS